LRQPRNKAVGKDLDSHYRYLANLGDVMSKREKDTDLRHNEDKGRPAAPSFKRRAGARAGSIKAPTAAGKRTKLSLVDSAPPAPRRT
jgi:hypothetical protein